MIPAAAARNRVRRAVDGRSKMMLIAISNGQLTD